MAAVPMYIVFVVFTAFLIISQVTEGSLFSVPTIYQRIYQEVDGIKPCFRLLNATHQIGCSASLSNVSGVLWYIESDDNLTYLLDNHHHSPYIVILEPHLFTTDNVRKMKHSKHVKGIVMYYNMSLEIPPDLNYFTPAESCPNSRFGTSECSFSWNTNGSGLTYDDFDKFQIFAITDDESYQNILQCFNTYNKGANGGYNDYPLCSAELQADMYGVISTPDCYRRAQVWTNLGVPNCQPLGDNNVWASLFELQENQDVIVVATKLDSSALIPDLSFGGNNEAAGIVTLLAVAETLGKLKKSGDLTGLSKQIMFVFFQGESFGYIGSSRMVYDMTRGEFPYKLDDNKQQPPLLTLANISSFLELSQVGIQATDTPTYYLHSNDRTSTLFNALMDVNETTFDVPNTPNLPPASAQMFLREREDLPVVVVTDYNQNYANKFFGSRYDTIYNLVEDPSLLSSSPVVNQLTNLATSITQVLLELSGPTPSTPPTPLADENTVSMLLECFLIRMNCSLLREVLGPEWQGVLLDQPASRYVTVNTIDKAETRFAQNLLAYFTGIQNTTLATCDQCNNAQSDSNQVYTYTTMAGTGYDSTTDSNNCTCYKSYIHTHEATSPAFAMKDYSSTIYSTWTESVWGGVGMRIYLVTFNLYEVGIFFAGLAISAVCAFVTWQCSRKSTLIFAVSANNKISQS